MTALRRPKRPTPGSWKGSASPSSSRSAPDHRVQLAGDEDGLT
jgi:hypothetical protein